MLEDSSSNSFIKTINDTDYTQTVQYVYLKLIDKYRNIARIGSEKKKFEQGNVRERLWAIFLVITKPELNLKYNS